MPHKPVCVSCQREMRPEQNGVGCLDMADFGPYKLWDSDKWKCPSCGYEILSGFGQGPISEHYQERFAHDLELWQNNRLVIKCWI